MVPLDELEVQMLLASFQSVLLPSEKIGRRNTAPWSRQSAATIYIFLECMVHCSVAQCWCCILCADQRLQSADSLASLALPQRCSLARTDPLTDSRKACFLCDVVTGWPAALRCSAGVPAGRAGGQRAARRLLGCAALAAGAPPAAGGRQRSRRTQRRRHRRILCCCGRVSPRVCRGAGALPSPGGPLGLVHVLAAVLPP